MKMTDTDRGRLIGLLQQLEPPIYVHDVASATGWQPDYALACLEELMGEGKVELYPESDGRTLVERTKGYLERRYEKETLDAPTIERLFAEGLKVGQVCRKLQISQAKFYLVLNKNPLIRDAMQAGRATFNGTGAQHPVAVRVENGTLKGSDPLIKARNGLFARIKKLGDQRSDIQSKLGRIDAEMLRLQVAFDAITKVINGAS